MDQIRLVSTYKGVPVPSMLFDSTGTKKIAALASYVIEALEQGRMLVVDELDSSIHFKLTRAIVAMFNMNLIRMHSLFLQYTISILWIVKGCFVRNRYGLCIKIRMGYMFIRLQTLQRSRE